MTDPVKEHLRNSSRPRLINPRPVTRLDDIRNEASKMSGEVRQRMRESVTNYQGNQEEYNKNKNRALIGLSAGLVGSLINPYLGLAGFTYAGIKTYQMYKDKKARL